MTTKMYAGHLRDRSCQCFIHYKDRKGVLGTSWQDSFLGPSQRLGTDVGACFAQSVDVETFTPALLRKILTVAVNSFDMQ